MIINKLNCVRCEWVWYVCDFGVTIFLQPSKNIQMQFRSFVCSSVGAFLSVCVAFFVFSRSLSRRVSVTSQIYSYVRSFFFSFLCMRAGSWRLRLPSIIALVVCSVNFFSTFSMFLHFGGRLAHVYCCFLLVFFILFVGRFFSCLDTAWHSHVLFFHCKRFFFHWLSLRLVLIVSDNAYFQIVSTLIICVDKVNLTISGRK